MSLLIVARKRNPIKRNLIGGVIVSSENLLNYLDHNKIKYIFIDTNKSIYLNKLHALLSIYLKTSFYSLRVKHIALNLNEEELFLVAPIAIAFSKLFKKKVSVRIFGGNLDKLFSRHYLFKLAIKCILKFSDIVFLQTNNLLKTFPVENVCHLPTCRYIGNNERVTGKRENFIFVGHISEVKGVRIILDSLAILEDIWIDFYGPLVDFTSSDLNTKNSSYKGIACADDIIKILSSYKFLVFPTFHDGEGYPGVIIESFAAGTPVISTNWRSVPELVVHGQNGFLVEPKSVDSLVATISNLNLYDYSSLSENSLLSFSKYDCHEVYKTYLDRILSLN